MQHPKNDQSGARRRAAVKRERLFQRFVVPGFVASVLSILVSGLFNWLTLRDKELEDLRSQQQSFTGLLTTGLLEKSGQLFADNNAKPDQVGLAKEQQETVVLLALDGLAETEEEERSILLVAARLLNSNATPGTRDRTKSGAPEARFLDVAVPRILARKTWWWNPVLLWDHDWAKYNDLATLVQSPEFLDLVASGFATEYYRDIPKESFLPTVQGDEELAIGSKSELLAEIGPQRIDGWVHLASWKVNTPAMEGSQLLGRGSSLITKLNAQRLPLSGPFVDNLSPPDIAGRVLRQQSADFKAVIVDPALVRERQPITALSAEGARGSLGRVIGVVSPFTCVRIVEPVDAVLVFPKTEWLPKDLQSAGERAKQAPGSGKTDGTPETMTPVVHLWAHVESASDCATQ
jgi:hypothetical protein